MKHFLQAEGHRHFNVDPCEVLQNLLCRNKSENKKEHGMKFSSIRLLVSDFSASVSFWRDVMGLSMTFGDETVHYAYFDAGNVGLELFSRDNNAAAFGEATPAPKPAGHQAIVSFQVDDVDATYADLVKRGATSFAPPQDRPAWQARTAHLSDPDGYLVEIYRPLHEASTPTA